MLLLFLLLRRREMTSQSLGTCGRHKPLGTLRLCRALVRVAQARGLSRIGELPATPDLWGGNRAIPWGTGWVPRPIQSLRRTRPVQDGRRGAGPGGALRPHVPRSAMERNECWAGTRHPGVCTGTSRGPRRPGIPPSQLSHLNGMEIELSLLHSHFPSQISTSSDLFDPTLLGPTEIC